VVSRAGCQRCSPHQERPDVDPVLSDDVDHIDRVIVGADVIRIEDSASGAAQWYGPVGHPLEQTHEPIGRYHRCCRAALSGRSDAGNGNGFSSTVLATDSDVPIDIGDFETAPVAARAADDGGPSCATNETDP